MQWEWHDIDIKGSEGEQELRFCLGSSKVSEGLVTVTWALVQTKQPLSLRKQTSFILLFFLFWVFVVWMYIYAKICQI